MAYREGQGLTDVKSPVRPERDWSGSLSLSLEGLTLVGNLFPALVAFRVKRRSDRTVTDYLIGALSINDMMAVLLPLPVSLPAFIDPEVDKDWTGGKASCIFYQFCVYWLQTAAMLLVTEMAFERYFALAIPMKYKSWRTHRRALGMITFVYIFTFLVSLMPVVGLAPPAVSRDGGRVCRSWIATRPDKWHQAIFAIFLIVQGWTTMLIVLMLNVNLIYKIWSYSKRMDGFDRNNIEEKKSIREFSKLVVVVAILFYLTWLPVLVSV
ncbi:5-hydroxytryptamine receptor 1A [Holothuria leucospilota]|uniref:5-hydroxytryptamine receptor 1A n=1 Tax=Holothuria leucospilota TaxID=206669 RepID=A0A9Q0YM86_HOLLE|nr:5-hydroxytryptamine receptor 1A [Holothuria leucospilota]